MSVSVSIPTPLRTYAGGHKLVAVSAPSVGAALGDLVSRYPGLRPHLYAETGELRGFVGLYVNDENVRDLEGAGTALAEGDTLTILPSIAGG
ncbi:MAG TPA: MoaD/ThiS family protein [Longimicrobiaceae bacterium]|nr:MoaD/ThiS family protein [Longimicrobiaceae bacterium]